MTGYDHWTQAAACAKAPAWVKKQFHIEGGEGKRGQAALADQQSKSVDARHICNTCPVKGRCADELWDDPYAVAGGLVPYQRRGPRPPRGTGKKT